MNEPQLILPADLRRCGEDPRQLAQRHHAGELVRVHRGVYIESREWKALTEPQKYGCRVAAFQASTPRPPVWCHATAALLWGLWIVGQPSRLHVVTEVITSGRSRKGITRHVGSLSQGVVQCGNLTVTDKLTTTFALIRDLSFPYAVAVCDSALRAPDPRHRLNNFAPLGAPSPFPSPQWHSDGPQGLPVSVAALRAAADTLPSRAARHRALAVITFASALSGSAGESISRALMHQYGFPAPVLQQRFTLLNGREALADFWFPVQRVVGEFDGKGKYLRSDWGHGAPIQERLLQEKRREDQIRAQGIRVVRWEWADMMNPSYFTALLRQAGLPQQRR